jgi:ribonuclease E
VNAEATPAREPRGDRGSRRPPLPVQPDESAVGAAVGAEPTELAEGVVGVEAVAEGGQPTADGEREGRRRRRRRGGRGREESASGAETDAEGTVFPEAHAHEGDTDAPPAEAAGGDTAQGEAAQGEGEGRRRGRGRDRYRRDRREDGLGDVSGETATEGLEANAALTEPPGVTLPEPAPRLAGDDVAEEPAARVTKPFEARAFVPAEAAAAPMVPPAPQPPVVPRFELPLSDLNALANAAGLEWVHSDATRVAQAQEAIANAPKPVRVPRERPVVVAVDEGPLVLVETRKDLSQVKLPFDAGAAASSAATMATAVGGEGAESGTTSDSTTPLPH